jgi:hypothetical protein
MTEITQTTVGVNSVYIIDDVNNTLVVDATRTRVGIGTTNPGYTLAVAGDIHGTGLVQGVNLTITSGGGGVLTFADGTTQATAGAPGTMSSWILSDGSAVQTISDGNTVQVLGGTGITSAVTATDTVTLNLDNTAVTPAAYGDATNVAQFTVDQQGRLTAAAAVAITYPAKAQFTLTADSGSNQTIADGNTMDIAGGTGLSSVVGATDTVTLNLDNTAVTAGSYTRASLTVDAQGRLTAASSGAAPDISGTIAAGQVAYGASADTIEGDNNLFWDTTNDRLGIGTNAPASSLHIIGVDDSNPEVRIQRSGVTTQYLSLMNEDSSGSFIASESAESNKKALYVDAIHNSGGSAAGDNLIIFRTGAASGPTERMRISDVNALLTVQSPMDTLLEGKLGVGSSTAPVYLMEIVGNSTQASGYADLTSGLFSTSSGESAISNGMQGLWLTARGMNLTSKFTPALKFGSTDTNFTTNNPKFLAGIVGRSTETYAGDSDGGMDLDFMTFPANGGTAGTPVVNMTLDDIGRLGIGTTTPTATLHASTADNIVAKFVSTDATASIELADNSTTNNAVLTRVGQTLTLCANGGNVAIGNSISSYNGSAPTDGQLLIGDTASGLFDAATLTAGSNITITNAAGAITIAASGGGGGGSPGGANTQVQFNNGGAFGGSADMIFSAPNMAVGFAAAGQSSGSISSDTINAVNVAAGANVTAIGKINGADLTTTTTTGYALTTTANHVWPGAPVGSNPTVMPAIDLAAASYDFASLGGAGNCNQTHYLIVVQGDPGAANAIVMPDPAAAGLPSGARWTITFTDASGQPQIVSFPVVPLNGVFSTITASSTAAVTLFTDGQGWFTESDAQTAAGRLVYA